MEQMKQKACALNFTEEFGIPSETATFVPKIETRACPHCRTMTPLPLRWTHRSHEDDMNAWALSLSEKAALFATICQKSPSKFTVLQNFKFSFKFFLQNSVCEKCARTSAYAWAFSSSSSSKDQTRLLTISETVFFERITRRIEEDRAPSSRSRFRCRCWLAHDALPVWDPTPTCTLHARHAVPSSRESRQAISADC